MFCFLLTKFCRFHILSARIQHASKSISINRQQLSNFSQFLLFFGHYENLLAVLLTNPFF